MPARRVPPVFTPLPAGSGFAGARALLHPDAARREAELALDRAFPGRAAVLTDSGTSALTMALRALVARRPNDERSAVALPAYACPDIGAAALAAGCEIRLYDTEPATLQPDMPSLRHAVEQGAGLVVLTHLFGWLVDVGSVAMALADLRPLIVEDAAQHAGGTLRDVRGGLLGDISILSFGRGKGLNAGGGGALLLSAEGVRLIGSRAPAPGDGRRGIRTLFTALATDLLSHPSVFAIPSAIPALAIGETRFRPATEPRAIPAAAAALLRAQLAAEADEVAGRHRVAAWYRSRLTDVSVAELVQDLPDSAPGALRMPVRLPANIGPESVRTLARLGVVRSYPRTLDRYPEFARQLRGGGEFPGANELARRLFTLPTHRLSGENGPEEVARQLELLHSKG